MTNKALLGFFGPLTIKPPWTFVHVEIWNLFGFDFFFEWHLTAKLYIHVNFKFEKLKTALIFHDFLIILKRLGVLEPLLPILQNSEIVVKFF